MLLLCGCSAALSGFAAVSVLELETRRWQELRVCEDFYLERGVIRCASVAKLKIETTDVKNASFDLKCNFFLNFVSTTYCGAKCYRNIGPFPVGCIMNKWIEMQFCFEH